MTKFELEEKIVAMLKTVYDPEIPVNIYDLGLIYKIDGSRLMLDTIEEIYQTSFVHSSMRDGART